jgi:hypothetical protein
VGCAGVRAGDPRDPEIFHQLLDHRWYVSQNQKRDVPLAEAVQSYVDNVLRHRRDEATMIDPPTGTFTAPIDIIAAHGDGDDTADAEDEDWRKYV